MSDTTTINHRKVIIVGGGPSGLTAAIYCGRAGLEPLVFAGGIDGSLMPGGQLMTTTEIENFPGFPEDISGPQLMEKMKKQAIKFNATIIEKWVKSIDVPEEVITVHLENGEVWSCDALIIATGATAKWLGLPNEDTFRNNGISACAVCDGPLRIYRNKHIYVVGGGDTAMEEATFLTKFASKVTIVHRRDTLRASKVMQQRAMDNPKIDFVWNSEIVGYEGDDFLTKLKIKNRITGEITTHPVGALFMGIGHTPMTKFTKESGIELDTSGYIKIVDHVHTNIPGVFACGDVHDTHYRQAITAAGFGCMAAMETEKWLESQ